MSFEDRNLEDHIQGTWWLLSREDRTAEGTKVIDPILGSDPIAILAYANSYFTAQFMKRDRDAAAVDEPTAAGENNTAAVGGYDAYFGTYQIEKESNTVLHTLVGSITPANIGIIVRRQIEVQDGKLIITLPTTSVDGVPITRTLTWERVK